MKTSYTFSILFLILVCVMGKLTLRAKQNKSNEIRKKLKNLSQEALDCYESKEKCQEIFQIYEDTNTCKALYYENEANEAKQFGSIDVLFEILQKVFKINTNTSQSNQQRRLDIEWKKVKDFDDSSLQYCAQFDSFYKYMEKYWFTMTHYQRVK